MSGRWTSAWTCVLFCATGCSRQDPVTHAGSGFPDSVQSKMIAYGCPTCHVIPGVPGAIGKVGPWLDSLSQRSYLAGRLANTSSNLEIWLSTRKALRRAWPCRRWA